MTGKEFYCFVNSSEGQGRYFIDMGDVVLESTQLDARIYRSEKDHINYLKEQEYGWSILSFHTGAGCLGEEIIKDEAQDVEAKAILQLEIEILHIALSQLDAESFFIIYSLYLSNHPKTERELAHKLGVSQNAVHKRKKKILQILKFWLSNPKKVPNRK